MAVLGVMRALLLGVQGPLGVPTLFIHLGCQFYTKWETKRPYGKYFKAINTSSINQQQ